VVPGLVGRGDGIGRVVEFPGGCKDRQDRGEMRDWPGKR